MHRRRERRREGPIWPVGKKVYDVDNGDVPETKFENVSSGLHFLMFVAQCISQNIKKHKILDTLQKSGFWEVAVVKKHAIWTMATSQELVFDDVSSVLCFFIFVAQCISQNIKKH